MKFIFVCSNGNTYEQVYTDTSDINLPGGEFIRDDTAGRLVYLWEYRSTTTGRIMDLEFHLYPVVLTGIPLPGGSTCTLWEIFGKVVTIC